MADKGPHIMIIEARFYEDLADELVRGATKALEAAGATWERFSVPGAFEIPAAINMARKGQLHAGKPRFDGYIALGVVIRGETYHFEIVAGESARGIMALTMDGIAVGNGILTTENEAQAKVRADPAQANKGADAARAAMALLALREKFG